MRVCIAGGGLQGVELCMLASLAGWRSTLIDRLERPIAVNLADDFLCRNLEDLSRKPDPALRSILENADLIVPALENQKALDALEEFGAHAGLPLAFDARSYAISSDKRRSGDFFKNCAVPVPSGPGYPMIAKPATGSGSRGVRIFNSARELAEDFPAGLKTEGWIFEEYCQGRQFSMEICGVPDHYCAFQLTELFVDDIFDCRAVHAPVADSENISRDMEKLLRRMAKKMRLLGIMDMEAILSPSGLRVLEIDARFPSQTPLAVWLSTGVNMLEYLASCFTSFRPARHFSKQKQACYMHVIKKNGNLLFPGEHSLHFNGPLARNHDIPGVEEALIGYTDANNWSAVLLLRADDPEALASKRAAALEYLAKPVFGG